MHAHTHGHDHVHRPARVLQISIAATLGYIVLLLVAGIRAHSLALISEAGHNASDFLALLLSLAAIYIQSRPPTSTKTYGYQRAGVLVAFLNSGAMVLNSFWNFYEAFERLPVLGYRAGHGRRHGAHPQGLAVPAEEIGC